MKISLGQYIREALKRSLEMEKNRETDNDSLFLGNPVFDGAVSGDLAAGHDEYLYGDKK